MANFNGYYKAEWKKRAEYFKNETDIAQRPVEKMVWAPKFFDPFRKKKKTEDTKLEKAFGAMDKTYAAMKKAKPGQFRHAATEFRNSIEAAIRTCDKAIALLTRHLEADTLSRDLDPAIKRQHEKAVRKLSDLYVRDLEAILNSAQAAFFREIKSRNEDGTKDSAGTARAVSDRKVRQAAMRSSVSKGLAWLNKLDRAPTVENFNMGYLEAIQAVATEVVLCRGVFTTPRDSKLLNTVHNILAPFVTGPTLLTDQHGYEDVKVHSIKLRKTLLTLGQWAKSVQT